MQPDQRTSKRNYLFCKETFELKENLEGNFMSLGERLSMIWKEALYLPNYDTFTDFLEDLKMSRATASKLIQIHEVLVMKYDFEPKEIADAGGWSSVSEVVPFATTKKEARMWLSRVKHNTRADLRRFIAEAKTGVKMDKCKHKNFYKIKICEDCKVRIKEHDEEE